MKRSFAKIAAIIAVCSSFTQPSRALDIGQWVQLFTLGHHAAVHFSGGTTLSDNFSNDMRVDGNKLFINYGFNSVSTETDHYLYDDPDPISGESLPIVQLVHRPGQNILLFVYINCMPGGHGQSCPSDGTDSNFALLEFQGPILPNDAPCICWHHLMISLEIDLMSNPSATYALDGGPGSMALIGMESGRTYVGPGGVIPYSTANKWVLFSRATGDFAEFYINTLQTFNVVTEQDKFRYTDSNHLKGLGHSGMNRAACELPGSTPEVCLRGSVAHFATQEDIDTQPPRHVFAVNGNPIEQALSDPCAFSFFDGCAPKLP